MYYRMYPTQPIQGLLPEETIRQYLQSCRGQYIRTTIKNQGTVVARLLGYTDKPTYMVQLDIAYPRNMAGYTEVHDSDLIGISCLGWTLPPEYQQPGPMQPGPMQPGPMQPGPMQPGPGGGCRWVLIPGLGWTCI
ncbi:hypothetical protein [Priestia filamentosa]|uniref:hypothetical protein n=1 Tax=Priestia filamentosa TaxID=1402861 RepID=UPI002E1BB83B|nr:hypothetical protein [Priestia filamentosa]